MESHKAFSNGKRLFELLEEQQEPFLLEVYLLENGYSSNLLKSQATVKCLPTETCRKFLAFSSHGIKSRRGGKLLSSVLRKFEHWKLKRKALNLESRVPGSGSKCVLSCFTAMGIVARASRFSRLLHSCEEKLDGERHWKTMEDSKQLSPVSVLELHSDEAYFSYNHFMEEEQPSTSTLNSDMSEEPHYFTWFSKLHQNEIGRKDLLPSKQTLLQCRKERKERIWGSHDSLINGKAEKSMGMQVFSLEKNRKEVARIAKLIDVDLSGTRREWIHLKDEARKIGLEIERLIFEEIKVALVVEMFGSHCVLE